jgi:hypothetical protein
MREPPGVLNSTGDLIAPLFVPNPYRRRRKQPVWLGMKKL